MTPPQRAARCPPIFPSSNQIRVVINLKTEKALGIEVPPKLLFTADDVIEQAPQSLAPEVFMTAAHTARAAPSSHNPSGGIGNSSDFYRLMKYFNNLNCGSLKVRKVAARKFFDREGGLDPKTIY